MALHRWIHRLRTAPSGRGPDPAASRSDLELEIERLEQAQAGFAAELDALMAAIAARRPERIPESLARPLPVEPVGEPSSSSRSPLETRLDRQRASLALLAQERSLHHQVLACLHDRPPWREAGARLRPLCQPAFDLSGFYLARADWAAGEIRFPYFYEAGRPGESEALPLDPGSGLTGWAMFETGPCYLESAAACRGRGMRFTPAELKTGLHTRSWFGAQLPSEDPARPLGLMAFHCYHARAFSPDQRRLMAAVARLAALFLDGPASGRPSGHL